MDMKKKPIVVTNNPKVKEFCEQIGFELIYIDGGYRKVLEELRDKIHINYHLLTHPLSGSIKPNETPYKSVAISKEKTFDMFSLELITNALDVYDRLQKDLKTPLWSDRILDDFMVIDLDLIKNALT